MRLDPRSATWRRARRRHRRARPRLDPRHRPTRRPRRDHLGSALPDHHDGRRPRDRRTWIAGKWPGLATRRRQHQHPDARHTARTRTPPPRARGCSRRCPSDRESVQSPKTSCQSTACSLAMFSTPRVPAPGRLQPVGMARPVRSAVAGAAHPGPIGRVSLRRRQPRQSRTAPSRGHGAENSSSRLAAPAWPRRPKGPYPARDAGGKDQDR